jgi:ribosomal 50S subunit-associated protein YjgA (DUF615 family)
MSNSKPVAMTEVEPEARQRRTVAGFLDDLRGHISRKRAELAGCDANRDKIVAELGAFTALLEEWDTNGD